MSLEHLSDEDLLRLVRDEEETQRKITETPYEYSRESRGVGGHMKTLYGKAKKVYHRVKDYLPSADTVLLGADAAAGGGALRPGRSTLLYGASHIVRHIPVVGKHLAVPLAVAGVAPGVATRLSAMRRGAGFLPGMGQRYMPNAQVINNDGEWRLTDRSGNIMNPAPLPQGSHNLRRPRQ